MKLLIVLLGSNPLPVFVTIKALWHNEGLGFDKLLFVFSTHTQDFCPYIRKALDLPDKMIEYCNLEDNQRRPQAIKTKLISSLQGLDPQPLEIHFNHTGGTKTMAIHGFTAIAEFAANRAIPLMISDLDPDCHKLNVTQNGYTTMYPLNGSYLDSIKCSIEDLTGLHGFTTKNEGLSEIDDTYLGMPLKDFFTEVLSPVHIMVFLKGKFHDKWSEVRDLKKIKKNHTKLPEHLVNCLDLKSKGKILNYFCLGNLSTVVGLEDKDFFANLYGILDFIDGKWLEYMVFTRIKALFAERQISADQVLLGHKVQLGDIAANRDCELDVVVMNGYQLTLISCTTSNRISTVKQKAFEAVFRANQLGGEQAKVLVVSMMSAEEPKDKNDWTMKSLEYDLTSFELKRNVLLAGKQHLQNCITPESHPDYESLDNILKEMLA